MLMFSTAPLHVSSNISVLVGAGLAATDRLLVHVLRLPLAPRSCRDLLPALEKRQEVPNTELFCQGP